MQTLFFCFITAVVLLQHNSRSVRQNLERANEIKPLKLLNKSEYVTFGLATKTIVTSSVRRDKKRRSLFVVKRTPAFEIRPGFFQFYIRGNKRDNIYF